MRRKKAMERDHGALLRRAETTTHATTPMRASRNGLFVRMAQIARPAAHNHHATGCRERRLGAAARVIPRPAAAAIGRVRDAPRAATTTAIRMTGRTGRSSVPPPASWDAALATVDTVARPDDPWVPAAGAGRCLRWPEVVVVVRRVRRAVVVVVVDTGGLRPCCPPRCWSWWPGAEPRQLVFPVVGVAERTRSRSSSRWSASSLIRTRTAPAGSRSTHCRSVRTSRRDARAADHSASSGSSVWNRQPSTSSGGLATPIAPPGRRWHTPTTPVDPCQYDQ